MEAFKSRYLLFSSVGVKSVLSLLTALIILVTSGLSQSRRYATITPSIHRMAFDAGTNIPHPTQGYSVAAIISPEEAIDQDETPAALRVEYRAPYYGEAGIQLKYGSELPANTTTFIRVGNPQIGYPVDPADAAKLLGSLIRAEVFRFANATIDGTQVNNSNVHAEIIVGVSDQVYLAVTSAVAYNSVRIYLKYLTNVSGYDTGSGFSMSVYYAFHLTPAPSDCGNTWASNVGEVKSGGLDLKSILTNPGGAVDADLNTYSTLLTTNKSGVHALQTIFFESASSEVDDQVRFLLSIPSAVLTPSIFDRITFQAYNGQLAVGGVCTLRSLISGDPHNLFSDNKKVLISVIPSNVFDRIKISVNSNTGQPTSVNVYQVLRVPASPAFNQNTVACCVSESVTLVIQNPRPDLTYTWYDGNQTPISGTNNLSQYTPANLPEGNHSFFIRSVKVGCPLTISPFIKAEISVHPKPGPPTVQIH